MGYESEYQGPPKRTDQGDNYVGVVVVGKERPRGHYCRGRGRGVEEAQVGFLSESLEGRRI